MVPAMGAPAPCLVQQGGVGKVRFGASAGALIVIQSPCRAMGSCMVICLTVFSQPG